MNVIVSSWPGAGATTLSILLAHFLKYSYLDEASILRFLCFKITGSYSLDSLIKFQEIYGSELEDLWAKYLIWKVNNFDNIVYDSRISGFFAENRENLFEVMLIAEGNQRLNRSSYYNESLIKSQDNVIRQRWINKYQVDIFSFDQIEVNYDLIIDTTNMDIKEEFDMVIDFFYNLNHKQVIDSKKLQKIIDDMFNLYTTRGFKFFIDDLQAKNMLIYPQEVLKEIRNKFSKDLMYLKPELQNAIAGL